MTVFVGREKWEEAGHRVVEKAESMIQNDFGDRLMIWSIMGEIFSKKKVQKEYFQELCSSTLNNVQNTLDLFNAEIKECLTSGRKPAMTKKQFNAIMKETPQITIRDHRIINPDNPQRRQEIRKVLLEAWTSEK